jgi:protein gp37
MSVDNTKIEWADATWSPVTGCDKVSPGCDHCYAAAIATRFAGTKGFPQGFAVTLRPGALEKPLHWRKPRRIFVNSMSDLFHDHVPDDYIAAVWAVMEAAPQHTFQILTKRPGRMRSWVRRHRPDPLPGVWLGVSAEDQHWADVRLPILADTPAAVRFVSAEPLLGPIDLAAHLPTLNWVIAGGESGPGHRPMHPDWARDIRDQCLAGGVPFLFKQHGGRTPEAGGRELDGRTWDQYPLRVPVAGS